jgi:hypothetical protein
MLIALIDNVRFAAKKRLHGICPGCLQPVIAKCGQIKIHHWAHSSKGTCACWWEPETEWHRSWKNHFPTEWQEIYLTDVQSNEKHVADIKTPHGLVIEFQHSRIKPEERISREKFYQNMVWVVDGTRLEGDYWRFHFGKDNNLRQTTHQGVFHIDIPDFCFAREWTERPVSVIFDFLGTKLPNTKEPRQNIVWCLFPDRVEDTNVVAALSQEYFVNTVKTNPQLLISAHDFISNLDSIKQKQIEAQKAEANRIFEQQRRMRPGRHFRF